jgi:hypothetical protein
MLREDCKERQTNGKNTGTKVQLDQRAGSSLLLPRNLAVELSVVILQSPCNISGQTKEAPGGVSARELKHFALGVRGTDEEEERGLL